jgi:hypothetical protein
VGFPLGIGFIHIAVNYNKTDEPERRQDGWGSIPLLSTNFNFYFMNSVLNVHGAQIDLSDRLAFRLKNPEVLKDHYFTDYRFIKTMEDLLSFKYITDIPWTICSDLMFAYELSSIAEVPTLFEGE